MPIMNTPQSGFTLIELLVSTIVLSIGLLGLAQLEIFSMKHSHEAYLRTQATHLAQDIADRMRANIQSLGNGEYERIFREQDDKRITDCLNPDKGCNPGEMAQNDAFDWRINLSTTLPSGQGIVCLDSSPQDGIRATVHGCDGLGSLYAIKIWWDDRNEDAILRRFVTSIRP